MMNMKLLAVVKPPSIYHRCSNRKTLCEEKFKGHTTNWKYSTHTTNKSWATNTTNGNWTTNITNAFFRKWIRARTWWPGPRHIILRLVIKEEKNAIRRKSIKNTGKMTRQIHRQVTTLIRSTTVITDARNLRRKAIEKSIRSNNAHV